MGEVVKLLNELPRDGLLADYRPPASGFDEMATSTGVLRSPWQQFIGGVNRAGAATLTQRSEQVNRLLRENGVTYNASRGAARARSTVGARSATDIV